MFVLDVALFLPPLTAAARAASVVAFTAKIVMVTGAHALNRRPAPATRVSAPATARLPAAVNGARTLFARSLLLSRDFQMALAVNIIPRRTTPWPCSLTNVILLTEAPEGTMERAKQVAREAHSKAYLMYLSQHLTSPEQTTDDEAGADY